MADITGNQNIVIQNVTDSTITIRVNDEIREISNQLAVLKALLQSHQTQTIQYADKIYNISHIDEANFGFLTGKKAFNALLTRSLIEQLLHESKVVNRFAEDLKRRKLWKTAWEETGEINSEARVLINYNYVGVLGIQLSKLMAIGQEPFSEEKQRKYIQKTIHIVKWSLDLLCFALLSALWDRQKEHPCALTEEEQQIIGHFFEGSFEPSVEEKLLLLSTLLHIFANNKLPLPLPELAGFEAELAENAPLYECCKTFQKLNERLDKEQYTLLDCFEAEKQLAFLLGKMRFWARYRMASVKQVMLQNSRYSLPMYLHQFTALGLDSKAQVDYTHETAQTESILLYKGDNYSQSINLFPFVIDYNALTFESGVKICFYRSKDFTHDYLKYTFLEDGSTVYLEKKDVIKTAPSLNDIMIDPQKRMLLNIDNAVALFQDAQTIITGDAALGFMDLYND